MKKVIIYLFVLLVLALGLVACGGGEETADPTEAPPAAEEEAAEEPTAEAAVEEAEAVETPQGVEPPPEEEVAQEEEADAEEEAAAPEEAPAAEEAPAVGAVVVQPPAMPDPDLLPIELFNMYVDDLPVEGWGKTYVEGMPLDPTMGPSNNGFPPAIFIDFSSPGDAMIPDPMAIYTMDVPQGRIFPVSHYLAMYQEGGSDYAQQAVSGLQQILDERPQTLEETLLTLPGFGDAQQGVRGKPTYFDFEGGSGVGFVAGYGQEIGPLLNDTLVYQFVGLTETHSDTPYGTQYISLVFPLKANFLSDLESVTEEEIAEAEADLTAYLAAKTEQINNAADSDFTPDLAALNTALQTITIGEDVVMETEEFCAEFELAHPRPEPDYNAKRIRDLSPFAEALGGFSAERSAELDNLLTGKTILDMQGFLESGELTSEELVIYYIDRIQTYDIDGLNSVLEINPQVLAVARSLDEERAGGSVRGDMHGIPILLKDNIATGDGLHAAAGAYAMKDWQPEHDAFLVQQLRNNGAIVLGKANLSEWANFMDFCMPNGFSALGGQTRNPYGPFDTYGSSSGSAVSAAAGLAAASVGSETQGSIISPAGINSVVAIKTSKGLVSTDHVIPLLPFQDVPGPMGRSVSDVAVLLTAMTGVDENDPSTQNAAALAGVDFTQFLAPEAASGLRIGIPITDDKTAARFIVNPNPSEEEMQKQYDDYAPTDAAARAIGEIFTNAGFEVVEVASSELPAAPDTMAALPEGYKRAINAFLAGLGDQVAVSSLDDIVALNNEDLINRAPYGQDHLEDALASDMSDEEFTTMRTNHIEPTREGLSALFEKNDIDVLITIGLHVTQAYAPAGFPAITIPAGYDEDGQPVGLILIGNYLGEPALITAAHAFEQATQARVEPDLEATMDSIEALSQ